MGGLVATIIIARAWGANGGGLYYLFLFLTNLSFLLVAGGMPQAITYFVSGKLLSGRRISAWLVRRAPFLMLAQSVFAWLYLEYFVKDIDAHKTVVLYMCIALGVVFFVKQVVLSVLQAVKDIHHYNRILSLEMAVMLAILVVTALAGIAVHQAIFASLVVGAIVATSPALSKVKGILSRLETGNREEQASISSYSRKSYPGAVLAFVNNRFSWLFVASVFGVETLGLFAVAYSIADKLVTISRSVSLSLFPRLAEKNENAGSYTPIVSAIVFWLVLPASAVLYVTADLLIGLLYGEEFAKSADIMRVLLLAIPVFSVGRIIAQDFAGMGRPELNAITSLASLCVNVALCLVLYKPMGVYGVAVAMSVSMIVNTGLKVLIWRNRSGESVVKLVVPDVRFIKRYMN